MITCNNLETTNWYQDKITATNIGGISFRTWCFDEQGEL
jgi:hypothetical protein